MAFKLYEFSNIQECDFALAKAVALSIEKKILDSGKVNIAFSGGKSPIGFFEMLNQKSCDWSKCNIFLVDERLVNLDHEDSNAKLIITYFLKNLAKKSHFQPYFENLDLPIEELLYKANTFYQQPDIAILGMGLDGHTASLFPETDEIELALSTNQNIILISPKNAPYKRLSMSLSAIEKCKELFLYITSKEKIEVLNKALKGIDLKIPISYILHSKKVICNVYFSK